MKDLLAEPAMLDMLAAQLQALVDVSPPEELRAWVAGCGNGEDAYACAILLHELAARSRLDVPIKVFATDVSQSSLAIARRGVYPAERLADLSAARRRAFIPSGTALRVSATVRESVIFAEHRLLDDPPFSRLSLIVCRAVFDMLGTIQQAQAMARFALALRRGGLLLLGHTLPGADACFATANHRQHLYARTGAPPQPTAAARPAAPAAPARDATSIPAHLPALVIDREWQILQLSAGVDHFLQPSGGPLSYRLLDVVHPQLRATVAATVSRALAAGRAAESAAINALLDGAAERITVIAQPLLEQQRAGELLVLFEAIGADEPGGLQDRQTQADPGRDEADEKLRVANEELRVANEELRVANEELQVANEEFQVASQELEARREELHTMNEELLLVNREQARMMEQLSQLGSDLQNLMASSDVGTLFLDRELLVRRYTPQLQTLFHFRPADIGRSLAHFNHELAYPELIDDAGRLLAELSPIEREVAHRDGRWFLVRLRPYRGERGHIGGVVLNFLDISARKRAEEALQVAHATLEQRVRERTAELEQAHATRRALLRDLVQAQERERLRIARDLHDQFGQQVTSILLGLRAAQDQLDPAATAAPQLDSVRGAVQALGRDMHQIAGSLRPTALDDVGLTEALQSYVESWSQQTGVAATFFETGVRDSPISKEVETTIYRVATEAMTNTARHAGASQLSVVLERHQANIIAIVEDNGRGFDVETIARRAQRGEHLGLIGMQERVELIDGTLTVESTPGSGTTVIVRLPLNMSERSEDGATEDSASR